MITPTHEMPPSRTMNQTKSLRYTPLLGLKITVTESRCPAYVNLQGVVADETKNTIILDHHGKKKTIPKTICRFQFIAKDGSSIDIDGVHLLLRPEERLKKFVSGD